MYLPPVGTPPPNFGQSPQTPPPSNGPGSGPNGSMLPTDWLGRPMPAGGVPAYGAPQQGTAPSPTPQTALPPTSGNGPTLATPSYNGGGVQFPNTGSPNMGPQINGVPGSMAPRVGGISLAGPSPQFNRFAYGMR
jgi:hypothetical protein